MKALTREWIAKAEADLQSAERETRRRLSPNLDVACFLAQQSIEKYLKGRLQEAGIAFARTHDLEVLARLIVPVDASILLLLPLFAPLSAYAVVFRYPGRSATRNEATHAVKLAKRVREAMRLSLQIPPVAGPTKRVRAASSRKRKRRSTP